ncbi:MAG: type transport system permease protein [Thermoleophilaceae bacterium]|nr:type transport system permease protein [Thermoleophilaceae bacterium]
MASRADVSSVYGRRIRGPSALGGDMRRFLHLTWTLAVTDFKLRFFGSILGYFWQLMRPLMLFAVLYFVFTEFVRIGRQAPNFAVVLLLGIVTFGFFADATAGSISSVVDRENLVRKIHFPRMVIPLSVVLTAYFNFLVNLFAVAVFALANGVMPRLTWLEFPVLILILGLWAVGLAMLLSALYVKARDVHPIWEVVTQAMFYAAPVIYPIEAIPKPAWGHIVMLNPLAVIIEQNRHAVIDPGAPTAIDAMAASWNIAIPAGIVLVSIVLGFWMFNREAPKIAESI